jgi:hypothetical protein
MKKRSFILLVLLLFSLFLVSCRTTGPGDTPTDVAAAAKQVQTGTQGVEFNVIPNYPPSTIYDSSELLTFIELKNKGNFNLEPQNCFVQITGFDPNIIKGNFNQPQSCASGIGGPLEGKSLYNLQGGIHQLEFNSPDITLPAGVFEYTPKLNILACYNYHTTANPAVCVDPLFYQITSEQKACVPTDVSMGGGQGAPIGISYVNIEMMGGRAIFEINVRNFGSGKVLSPFTDIRTCGLGGISYQDLDKVAYNVQLTGGTLIDCKPQGGFIRLNNGAGKIICNFNIAGTTAYETPLLVDLDYSYVNSIQKQIQIIKTPE